MRSSNFYSKENKKKLDLRGFPTLNRGQSNDLQGTLNSNFLSSEFALQRKNNATVDTRLGPLASCGENNTQYGKSVMFSLAHETEKNEYFDSKFILFQNLILDIPRFNTVISLLVHGENF